MPAVVFVTTLEPKDGRRDELVGLLAELAKHIRGEPGFMQYSVYRPLGVPYVVTQRDTDVSAVRERLVGRTSVLVGHSGVGKSTLVNALVPDAMRSVGIGTRLP